MLKNPKQFNVNAPKPKYFDPCEMSFSLSNYDF